MRCFEHKLALELPWIAKPVVADAMAGCHGRAAKPVQAPKPDTSPPLPRMCNGVDGAASLGAGRGHGDCP